MATFDDAQTDERLLALRRQEEERYVATMATQLGYAHINLLGYTINPGALALIPEAKARAAGLAAFDRGPTFVKIAVRDPRHPGVAELLTLLSRQGLSTEIYLSSTASLEHAWERYRELSTSTARKKGIFDFDENDIVRVAASIKTLADVKDRAQMIATTNNARRTTETLELTFAGAIALDASDIHIEPEDDGIRLRYRLDGVLHDILTIDASLFGRIISRLKLLSGMTLNKKQEAQDGRFTFILGEREIEVRVSVLPAALGESVVMRLLDPGVASFSMDKLQLSPAMSRIMDIQLRKKTGMIVTTGPTGSGKTTALYAFLQKVHTSDTKIITIENPVEYKLEGIVQTQTGPDYTFASGLRSVLRQDPDVIMVGEIRDKEVAETALQAAQTGHLVFTTLHTNNAVGGFPRLISLGADPRMFKSSINIMLGQRLVRLLCPHCKKACPATENETTIITRVMTDYPDPVPVNLPYTLYTAGPGCEHCAHTGYKRRIAIFEAIMMDDAVEEALLRDPREHTILEAAKPQKIPSMVADGMFKVLRGDTSFAELERVVDLPRQPDDPPYDAVRL
jgi:type IV pilus assembly protein PilB